MSIHVISWVLEYSETTLGDRLVLLVLADHAKSDGTAAWPSIDTIARQARLSERAVQYALRNLETAGAIVETGRSKQGTHIYSVVMVANEGGADSAGGGVQILHQGGVQSTAEGGATAAPEPSFSSTVQDLDPAAPARARDELWDELVVLFGAVADNTNAHAKRNKAVADLRRLSADVAGVRRAVKRWPMEFPGTTLTDVALATHYPQLAMQKPSPQDNGRSVEENLDLPEVSEEERAANVERMRQLAQGIGS